MTYPDYNSILPSHNGRPATRPIIDGIAVYKPLVELGNSGATKTLSFANGHFQRLVLTANCTFTLVAPNETSSTSPSSQYIMRLHLTQGGAGHPTYLVSWPAATLFASGTPPVLSANTGETDILELYYAAGAWHVSQIYHDASVSAI